MVGLKIRRLFDDEEFEVNGQTYVFTSSANFLAKFLYHSTHHLVVTSYGWAVYFENIYRPFGIVAGKPGNWRLYYAHEEEGWLSESIRIPRTAKYRLAKLIAENPA